MATVPTKVSAPPARRSTRSAPPLTLDEQAAVIRRLHHFRWRSTWRPVEPDGKFTVAVPFPITEVFYTHEYSADRNSYRPCATGSSGHTFAG